MQSWIDATVRTVDERQWRTTSGRGRFLSYSFVAEPRVSATLDVLQGGLLLGDVPIGWTRGSAEQPPAARLLTRPVRQIRPSDTPGEEFALALWSDTLERLLLLRCPMGTRALYCTGVERSWLAFASMPEPLLAIPWSTSTIDQAGLAASLVLGGVDCVPRDTTLFANLKRLPAGGALEFSAAGTSHFAVPFWPDARGQHPAYQKDDPAVPRDFRRVLEDAVERRLAGKTSIGTLLSGGLDSAAVLGLVHSRRTASQGLFAYTSDSRRDDGAPIDPLEHSIASELIDRLGSVTHRSAFVASPNEPSYLSRRDFLERPLPDLVARIPYGHLIENAAQDKVDVVFTGWGGDEMASSRIGASRAFLHPLLASIRGRRRWSRDAEEMMRAVLAGRPLAGLARRMERDRESLSVRQQRRNRLRKQSLHLVMELFDWFAQREGLSVVHPLIDRQVLLFCDSLPADWIANAAMPRRALRESVSDLLPAAAISRHKSRLPRHPPDPIRWSRYANYQCQRLDDLARSDTWLHDYLDLRLLSRLNAKMAADWHIWRECYPVWYLGAGALVVSRSVSNRP